jgi:hypothetical protein
MVNCGRRVLKMAAQVAGVVLVVRVVLDRRSGVVGSCRELVVSVCADAEPVPCCCCGEVVVRVLRLVLGAVVRRRGRPCRRRREVAAEGT